ncbi:hypothetical protein [Streptomyces sp. CB01881]|uniref:hypothetical protein n=1 Tax=Streptomyces sp. CB01881 TaxID=2078691 RepID=UPI0011DFE408|nr:hypothetical protein [Streptomyces sp. CB01881]TYC69497.1 hypothetical protein EH183_35660 [Streptomyces sp. CB01881]
MRNGGAGQGGSRVAIAGLVVVVGVTIAAVVLGSTGQKPVGPVGLWTSGSAVLVLEEGGRLGASSLPAALCGGETPVPGSGAGLRPAAGTWQEYRRNSHYGVEVSVEGRAQPCVLDLSAFTVQGTPRLKLYGANELLFSRG